MEGLATVAGEWFRPIEVGGRAYRLAPPRLRDLAALEAEILARQPDPLEQAARAAQHVPADQAKAFWDAAFAAARKVRRLTLQDLEDLPEATQAAAAAFLLLQRHHASEVTTIDEALAWCERAAAEHGPRLKEILASVREPDGGPHDDGAQEKKRTAAERTGVDSSGTAPSGSVGRPASRSI